MYMICNQTSQNEKEWKMNATLDLNSLWINHLCHIEADNEKNGKDPDANLLSLPSRSSAMSLDSRQAERSQDSQVVAYLPPVR